MAITSDDLAFLSKAIVLARSGQMTTAPNPAVGCVVVRHGNIIGQGFHLQAGGPHAEVNALADADIASEAREGLETGQSLENRDVCVYVTLEPCSHTGRTPPCVNALIAASVGRVVVGMYDPNPRVAGRGVKALRQAGIRVDILQDLAGQQLFDELLELNAGYIHRHRTGRPLVRLKLAASLDGRTAMADGESQWITGPASRADVHALRGRSGAIITGVDTVLADNAALTVRPDEHCLPYPKDCEPFVFANKVRQPIRVVLDSDFRLPSTHRLCQQPGQTLIIGTKSTADPLGYPVIALSELNAQLLSEHKIIGCLVDPKPGKQSGVPLSSVLIALSALEVNSVLVESGSTLAGAFIKEGCVDELWLYQAPKMLGDSARALVKLDCPSLSEAIQWHPISVTPMGSDWRMIFRST